MACRASTYWDRTRTPTPGCSSRIRLAAGALAAIELDPDEEIAVVIGTPPNSIPATFDVPPGT